MVEMAATMEVGVMVEGLTEGMRAVETEEERAEEKTEIEECPKEVSWCSQIQDFEAGDKFPVSKSSNNAHSLVPVRYVSHFLFSLFSTMCRNQ